MLILSEENATIHGLQLACLDYLIFGPDPARWLPGPLAARPM